VSKLRLKIVSTDSILAGLSGWYLRQCDGNWEHGFGFKITALDNPGVAIDISLEDTELANAPFAEFKDHFDTEDCWMTCSRTHKHFQARGAATRFEDMLRIFLDWADAHRSEPGP
jgi:hypothetical protein